MNETIIEILVIISAALLILKFVVKPLFKLLAVVALGLVAWWWFV